MPSQLRTVTASPATRPRSSTQPAVMSGMPAPWMIAVVP